MANRYDDQYGGPGGGPKYRLDKQRFDEVAPAPVSVAGAQDAVAPQASGKRKYVSLTRDIARQKKLAEALSRMGAEEGSASTVGGITAPMSALGPLVRGLTSFGGSYLSGKAEGDMDAATDEEQAAVDAEVARINARSLILDDSAPVVAVPRMNESGEFVTPELPETGSKYNLSPRDQISALTQLASRSDIGKEAAGLYMPIALSDLERERELADTEAAKVAALDLYGAKERDRIAQEEEVQLTPEELEASGYPEGAIVYKNITTGKTRRGYIPPPPTLRTPPNLDRGDFHRLSDGTKVRAIFDPATGESFYMQGGNRTPLPNDAIPVTAGAGQVTYQNMKDLRDDYSITDASIVSLDDFLNTVEKSGVGLERFANEVSGNLKTLFKGNEPLTEGQLNAALVEGKLNRLLGMFRIDTVGGGNPSNFDMERIVKSLVGKTTTLLQDPQVIKALLENVRDGKRLRLERLEEDFQFMAESGSLGNFNMPKRRSKSSGTPPPAGVSPEDWNNLTPEEQAEF